MSKNRTSDEPSMYEIRVKGCLGPEWSAWFDGFTISPCCERECLMAGPVPDQAALHGLLAKIRDLGLPLLLVKQVAEGEGSS